MVTRNIKHLMMFIMCIMFLANSALGQEPKLTKKQRDQLNAEAMKQIAGHKRELEQQYELADKKARSIENQIKVMPGPITEKDQQVIDELAQGAIVTPNVFRTETGALKFVRILLKGKHNDFRFFHGYKTEAERKFNYDEAMASALSFITSREKNIMNVANQVLESRKDYPKTIEEARRIINRK